ncbi:hypothetical protein CAPTEDRAFT_197714 [Capitella teleta]|uniref:Uncharacterized protein n=1 Tax=Capitella teleta TaxID=283909 RepID=R7TZI2_CAPTE|nr:hypothetical protein CAPTEDRAFT_197714 [Capitella teleta]|eukprot:ELT99057.1 hypothetical protein CAPTEDRAFT_197714 [Capitella teleta]
MSPSTAQSLLNHLKNAHSDKYVAVEQAKSKKTKEPTKAASSPIAPEQFNSKQVFEVPESILSNSRNQIVVKTFHADAQSTEDKQNPQYIVEHFGCSGKLVEVYSMKLVQHIKGRFNRWCPFIVHRKKKARSEAPTSGVAYVNNPEATGVGGNVYTVGETSWNKNGQRQAVENTAIADTEMHG